MTTENPKISAYVPQIIYERFKEFKEERNLSFSQAAIELFAEYFGINLLENSTKEYTGGLPERVSQLEQLVTDLKQSYAYLSEKVDSIQSAGEPLAISLPISGSNSSLHSEPLTNLLTESSSDPDSELPITKFLIEQENKLLNNGELLSNKEGSSLILLSHQSKITNFEQESNSLSSSLLSNPLIKINYPVLAIRLKSSEQSLRNKRSASTLERFTEWITKKDPDKIAWYPTKEGKKVYYSPSQDLTDEQKLNLQKWLGDNKIM